MAVLLCGCVAVQHFARRSRVLDRLAASRRSHVECIAVFSMFVARPLSATSATPGIAGGIAAETV
jgi:hypothetical protein